MKSNDDYVRERAELAGLSLSDQDVRVIRQKWEDTPLCNLDDLLSGIRRLQELPRDPVVTTTLAAVDKE